MNRFTLRPLTLAAAASAAVAALLTGCSAHSAAATVRLSPAAVHASAPRCLSAQQAVALVKTMTGPHIALDAVHGYGCAGGWAYVNYRQVPYGNQATKALQYVRGSWVIGDRLLGCGDGSHRPAMPPSIARYGCGN